MKPLALALLFIASLAGSSALLPRVLPPANIPQFSEKIVWFAAHKDDYDAVFVGSSQFYHGIDPRQFDRDAERGTRTFNFGLDGLWPAESFYVLRHILAQRPRRLRWVFIDWMDIDPRIDTALDGFTTQRLAHWHDSVHTAMTLRRLAEMPDLREDKARLAGAHLALWARCFVHHGRAGEWLNAKLRKPRRVKIPDWVEREGLRYGKSNGIEGEALAQYPAQLDLLRKAGPRPPMGPTLDRALRELIAEVRAAGATPVLIASPAADPRHRFAPPVGVEAWIFNDPERCPELFDPSLRYDHYHLNPKGAELFSRLLAARFAALVPATSRGHP